MWIHILIFLIFCGLFLFVRGFFSKSGVFLAGKLPDFLQLNAKQMQTFLLILFCGNLLGFVLSLQSYLEANTVKEGYLVRNDKGEGVYEEELMVSDGTVTEKITVVVDEISYTEEELQQFLDAALDTMESRILGENESLDYVEYPLNLMTEIEGTPVAVEWNTDQPLYLDWEGKIGEDVPKSGVKVQLTGELTAGGYLRVYETDLVVYPENLPANEALIRDIKRQLTENEQTSEEYQDLPKEVDGKTLIWHKPYAQDGWLITGMAAVVAVLLILSERSREKELEKKNVREMQLDYPLILNKLILFMRAGVSSRMAIRRIVEEYQQEGNLVSKRAAYEELSRMYFEMEQGIPEEVAYERFAARCNLMEYRTLSNLLTQNLKKGSSQFLSALEQECRQAFEERKRRALIAGEEARTKLLMPMMLMLLIVLMMIMVPSFLSF